MLNTHTHAHSVGRGKGEKKVFGAEGVCGLSLLWQRDATQTFAPPQHAAILIFSFAFFSTAVYYLSLYWLFFQIYVGQVVLRSLHSCKLQIALFTFTLLVITFTHIDQNLLFAAGPPLGLIAYILLLCPLLYSLQFSLLNSCRNHPPLFGSIPQLLVTATLHTGPWLGG